ncbi:MAG TPA: molybdenum cofactor biosynthesis protein MoaE [Gemmatimonadales bacterium]|nr:molybdenum cofactor biosynthesis protein MoaE [Gemmatimonadales bacterium]
MAFLTRDPVHLDALIARITGPDRGGVVTFLGLVRDHHEGRSVDGLEYSAYEPMAEAVCAELIAETESRWPVRAALSHRVGPLGIGEAAVAIAVAAPHRDEAFAACRHLIEELKRRVPIWKQESYSDGTRCWVDPTAGSTKPSDEERAGARPW